MKHDTHPSPRQRLFAMVATAALALLLGASTQSASAQLAGDQNGAYSGPFGQDTYWWNIQLQRIYINNGLSTECSGTPPYFKVVDPQTAWDSLDYGGVEKYFSMQAGNDPVTFAFGVADMEFDYFTCNYCTAPFTSVQFLVDGNLCTSCTVTAQPGYWGGGSGARYLITYNPGTITSKLKDGSREFAFRMTHPDVGPFDIRFRGVMIGASFTEIPGGRYNAPALPLYILRDPPGDLSYSSITSASDVCTGNTSSITTGNSQDGFFKARIGVAGSIGLIATVDYEIYAEVGLSLAASQSQTGASEYSTCISTVDAYKTPDSGAPDDVFIGSAVRYAYGIVSTVSRPACDSVSIFNEFISMPVGRLTSYNYTESFIREDVIPDLIADIAALPPGAERDRAETQLSVWYQTLAMNDSIKANAPYLEEWNFPSSAAGVQHDITSTTTEAYTIDYDAQLEAGLSFEFGVNIGGSGITAGGSARFQQGYGRGESGSNATTNTMGYFLDDGSDGDDDDFIRVKVYKDHVFGSYVFQLDSAVSRTSCPYEGGYQIDQPQLWIGSMGSTNAQLNEVPIGGNAIYPIYVCNNSDEERTYLLTSDFTSNPLGAIISGYNGITSGSTVSIVVPPNGCGPVGNIYLSQPDNSIVDFDGIQLTLSSGCGDVSTAVTLSAHFGAGNFGSYCQPSSTAGTTLGDYVDGVVLGNISNTGTGSVAGAFYTDYSAQFSTPLSRNAQQVVSITAGTGMGDHFAVWIDYDQDRTFEASEKLGEFENSAAGESQNIAFTVPVNAQLGNTIMRVRGVHFATSEPAPVDPCYSYQAGETEDYAVVIDANTPQDCAGVDNGTALPGTSCDDNDANTGNDTWTANCACVGQTIDCVGVPGGTTTIGSPCDDGDTNTGGDAYDGNCLCAGLTYDCMGIPGGTAVEGAACDDGDAATGNDVYDGSCLCAGQLIDCVGVPGGTTLAGSPCDDGNPLSGGDAYNANCECVGAFATDCAGVEGGTAQPGTACDDNDGTTGNDTYSVNCVCAGEPFDCAGIVGGAQLPGTPCDDGNFDSNNDVFTADCGCLGELANDCAGVPGGTAQPGSTCDDGDADTGNDVYNAFCECAGERIDCNGVVGGPAQPGFGCDDGNAATGADLIDENCQCAGQLLDCLGVPGGEDVVGTPCDDGDANTSDDVYTANCICAGTLALDCEGVAGGTAQPGTTCDDGDANTGNDAYSANCECAGLTIDCEGTVGGGLLPGTPCDDGLACTANDVRGADCACSGTTITIGAVTGASSVVGNTSNAFVITPIANATSYTWELPNGWTTSDNGAFVLLAEANNTAGPVQVCVTAMVGDCELTSCITVNVDFNTGIATNEANDGEWFTVQPNPSNGIFQLRPSTTDATPLRISIRNGLGQEVLAPFSVAGQRAIDMDLSDVAAGAYYLLATRNGEQHVIKIMVQR